MNLVPVSQCRRHFLLGLLASTCLTGAILPGTVALRRADAAEDGPGGRLLRLINALRVDEGRAPLRLDSQLVEAAQRHSEDMATGDFFDHTSSNGVDIDARLTRAGYTYKVVAENIAAGSAVPEKTLQDWMRSGPPTAIIFCCPRRAMPASAMSITHPMVGWSATRITGPSWWRRVSSLVRIANS